jgi:oligopeptidase A
MIQDRPGTVGFQTIPDSQTQPMPDSSNPLLRSDGLPAFDRIRAEHVGPAIRSTLAEANEAIESIVAVPGPRTYDEVLGALDRISEVVSRRIAPVQHLLAVAESPELREAYNEVLPEVSAFWARIPLNRGLWQAIVDLAQSGEASSLDGIYARDLERTLAEFRHAGADLEPDHQDTLAALKVELSQKERTFGENVLDATNAWSLHLEDETRLAGVPEAPRRRFRERAASEGLDGYLLSLDFPSFEAVIKHASDRSLRQEIHGAYVSRCRGGSYDNTGLIREILGLRLRIARLVGFEDFPDYRLEQHMAKTGEKARSFVADLVDRTRPYWTRDIAELQDHARTLGIDRLEPWDVGYVSERRRKARFDIDDEALRPYFPLPAVEAGLYELVQRVFGLSVTERSAEGVWHSDVRVFDIHDEDGTHLATFYADWYPRPEKRQGAWMNPLATGGPTPEGGFEPHLGFIGGNFTPPDGEAPALLTHREVQTLFHEFGHLLHHAVSRSPVRGRGGLNVPWDFVELPSQLMENWTWEREALDLFARHWKTGAPLPDEMFARMFSAKRFMAGKFQMRQLSFGSMDLGLHTEFDPEGDEDLLEWIEDWLAPFSPTRSFAEQNIATVFTHLFAGGYAAAYYSYLWAEVLEADAFSRFRTEGLFNRETGRDYVEAILSRGDSADPGVLFQEFMGRDPDPEALIARNLGDMREEQKG